MNGNADIFIQAEQEPGKRHRNGLRTIQLGKTRATTTDEQ